MAVAHVDDFLISVDPHSVVAKEALQMIKSLYEWGTWEETSFTQSGARMVQTWDRTRGYGT
eukprot:11100470-Prorocentrum_lima.AAC.1